MYVCLLIVVSSYVSVYDCLVCIDHIVQSPVISVRQIHGLSSLIASKWRQVAFCLKLQPMERCEVDEITTQHPGNLQEQAMEMLQRWKDRDGRTVTVDVTCEVLITASCKAEAEEVFGVNAVQKVHSQMTDSDSESQSLLLKQCRCSYFPITVTCLL